MNPARSSGNIIVSQDSAETIAQRVRGACERVERLCGFTAKSTTQNDLLAEAFEELFVLLEQLRLAQGEFLQGKQELSSSQEILSVEQQRYLELLEHAPDGYVLSDPRFIIEASNLSFRRMLKLDDEQIGGMPLTLFIVPEDLTLFQKQLVGYEKGNLAKVEFRIQGRSKQVVPLSVTIGPFHDAAGKLAGIHWLLRDLSEAKKWETARAFAEDRYQSIRQSATDAIIIADQKVNIISWNQGAKNMFGYEEEEVIGKSMTIIIPERYRNAHSMGVERFIATGVPRIIGNMKELYGLRKDGTEIPIELALSTWKTGEDRFFSGIIRDITERKHAEEAKMRLLERLIGVQEEERRRIARELHDETGQSLTCLLMGLKIIEESRTLKSARNEAARLREITSRTLEDVGRLAAGLHPTVLEDLGLAVALRRYASEIADSSGIVIRCEADGVEGQRLPLDTETGLFRIAQEALTNGAKHANAKQIEIIMKKNHGRVYLAVQDNGNGFDVKTALRTAAGSNRLGLHGMMERAVILGGSLQIDSAVGRGTMISIEVDLRSSDEKN